MSVTDSLRGVALLLCFACALTGVSLSQAVGPSPSSQATSLPLSGRPQGNGSVTSTQTAIPGTTTSVNTLNPAIQVQGPYAGSANSTACTTILAPFMIRELLRTVTETAFGSHPRCVVSISYNAPMSFHSYFLLLMVSGVSGKFLYRFLSGERGGPPARTSFEFPSGPKVDWVLIGKSMADISRSVRGLGRGGLVTAGRGSVNLTRKRMEAASASAGGTRAAPPRSCTHTPRTKSATLPAE